MICLTRHPVVAVDDLPWFIVAEFDEEPGLRLTSRQVRDMWGLPESECASILDFLTTAGMLRRIGDQYCRPPEVRAPTPAV